MARDVEALVPGDLLGRWCVEAPIGRGAAGTVYRVREVDGPRTAAMKVLTGALPQESRRFENEIALLTRIDHPRIVRLLDSFREGEFLALVCELMTGGSLRERIGGPHRDPAHSGGGLPIPEVLAVLRDVLEGLAHIHEQEILHRDLKPENILRDPAGRARLVDFGLARLSMEETIVTQAGQVKTTLDYSAPEILMRSAIDHRADLYAVGIVLFEMLTGHVPFPDRAPAKLAMAHVSGVPAAPTSSRPDLSPWWDRLVAKLLEKSPADRYANAGDLLEDLEDLDGSLRDGR